jgi:RHH-type proline utilization regulon transcriptional repressor/proline dehydrogenase/delta 1-pyrroline-5-carboxylate dehydrogenase
MATAANLNQGDVGQAIVIARRLQSRARELQTPAERRQQAELDRMIQSPSDKATLIEITDQAFRAQRSGRAADQLIHILDVQGVPRFFSAMERTMLRGFQSFGAYLPGVAMPLVKEKMREETANVILPAEEELLAEYLEERRRDGLRMNVNYLGEALLGEGEAQSRLQSYLQALQRPEIEVISVKISTIYSQISALARQHTVDVLSDRLELLYRAAAKSKFRRGSSHPEVLRGVRHASVHGPDPSEYLGVTGFQGGAVVPKFVYLDMEEYRDKEITAEVFMRTLERKGLERVEAGIALQAYIPDSFATQQRITEWARRRKASGGAPVTIRIVKGANMEMERVEASLRGWPLATFSEKADTDANYHRMLRYGMQPENLAAVRLGVASHNLFTLAYGLVLAGRSRLIEHVQFEMLEGMANHQRRALVELVGNMLLYAPACRQEEFINAIGYLVRRLDENTGSDNFLRYAFNLEVDSPEWRRLEQGFVESFARIDALSGEPRRGQDRDQESGVRSQGSGIERAGSSSTPGLVAGFSGGGDAPALNFANEPDTDWSLPHNSSWGAGIVERWQPRFGNRAADVPLVIAGDDIYEGRDIRPSHDPSRPGVTVANYHQATAEDADRAVACAAADPDGWRRRSPRQRTEILFHVAEELARRRGDLMGAMLAEGGKILSESDPEVSEAIDFCRFYAESVEAIHRTPLLALRALGVVVVVSPWNFPLAIPCGGVAAALAAGNTVILKPASHTVMIAHLLCECFWAAGVPRTALQFVPCSGSTVGQQLVSHDAINAVVLTGGTATALEMLRRKPTMNLLAETGGKNATIVTALSDRDLAIKNVLHSAFSHSGQKCSATSLLILEEEVYHDRKFRDTLVDAVESMHVGSAWDLHTKINPLILPPSGDLERALKELEPGESWAVMPRFHVAGNPHLVSPAIKWGVQPNSVTHCTEFFGPVLGVMSSKNLDEAIDLVNATGYGLTSGLESLDDREHQIWQEGVRAGNLYINRPTTGAIVLRQPFGGMGKSAFGPGIKAGGPNYVVPLMAFEDRSHESGVRSQESAKRAESSPTPAKLIHAPPPPLTPPRQAEGDGRIHLLAVRELLASRDADANLPEQDATQLCRAIDSYLVWMAKEFGALHDHFRLVGEDNFRRYLPVVGMRIRIHTEDSPFEVFARSAAARAAGCRAVVSAPMDLGGAAHDAFDELDRRTDSWAATIEFVEESDEELAESMRHEATGRVRYAHPGRVPELIRRASAESYVFIADAPVLAHGRVELLWYLEEQSLSRVYHRYGNLGRRTEEPRTPVR